MMMFSGGKKKYIGEFKKGKFEGKGQYFYSSGDRYEGEFRNNLKEGKGKIFCLFNLYIESSEFLFILPNII